jgi:hypothetical protein
VVNWRVVAAFLCLAVTPVCQVIKGRYCVRSFEAIPEFVSTVQVLCFIAFVVLTLWEARKRAWRTVAILAGALCLIAYLNSKIYQYCVERYFDRQQKAADAQPQWEDRRFPDVTIRCPPQASVIDEGGGRYTVRDPRYQKMLVMVLVHGLSSDNGKFDSTDDVGDWLMKLCESQGLYPAAGGVTSVPYQLDATRKTSWFRYDSVSTNGVRRCDVFVPVGDTLVLGNHLIWPGEEDVGQVLWSWVAATCAGLSPQ